MALTPTAVYQVNSAAKNATSLVTTSFTPAVGEVVVVTAFTEDSTFTLGTVTGGTSTWASRFASTTVNNCRAYAWTTTITTAASMTVTVPVTGGNCWHSMTVSRWPGVLAASPAIGSAVTNTASSTTVTTVAAGSAVVWACADWNAVAPGSPTYRSSATALGTPFTVSGSFTQYSAYQQAVAAGSQTFGLSSPTGQQDVLFGIEVQASTTTLTVSSTMAGAGSLTTGSASATAAALAGTGSLTASGATPPGQILGIGAAGVGPNYFDVQVAPTGAPAVVQHTRDEIVSGYAETPYFVTAPDNARVQFWARLDAPVTSGASFSRCELREVNSDGTAAAWDSYIGTHTFDAYLTPTNLPSITPAAVFWQMFDGVATADRLSLRAQLVSTTSRLRLRVNGATATLDAGGTDISTGVGNIVGVERHLRVVVSNGGALIYIDNLSTPILTVPNGTLANNGAVCYFKSGIYNQASTATGDSATDFGSLALRPASAGGSIVSHAATVVTASAVLSGAGSLTALSSSATSATLTGSGSLSATPALRATASLSGAGSLTASATVAIPASAALSGSGSLTSTTPVTGTNATLAGSGSLTATRSVTQLTTATFTGSGSLAAAPASAAGVVHTTAFSHVLAGGATFTVTIPAVTAGNKLVLACAGGALASGKLTNTSGTAFTLRTTYGGGAQDVSIQDVAAAGGETAVFITLNGAENVSGTISEVSGLGSFIGASSNGTGVAMTSAADYQCKPTASVNVASGNAVAFGVFSATSSTINAEVKWRQIGPFGQRLGTGNNQPGSNTEHIWQTAVADVAAAGRWPLDLAGAGDYRMTSVFVGGSVCFAAQALYANTGPAFVAPAVNPIVAENSLPGSYVSSWLLGASGTNTAIAGYSDKPSYSPGDTVSFKVDSGTVAHRIEVYRLGHYGYDLFGARNVLGAQGGFITATPTTQSTPSVDSTLGSTSCAWTTTATWTVPSTAAPGVYHWLARSTVTPANVTAGQFVVTGAAGGKVAVVLPDMTYAAYNPWGASSDGGGALGTGTWTGRNLYQAGTDGATSNVAHRAYAVSLDRPMGTQSSQPQTYFYDAEMELINFLEAQGYNLSYHSTWDLDASTTLLNSAQLVVIPGHHEYWTTNVYDCVKNAADAGVNLFFESSNTALWRTRFAVSDIGRRTMICYKDSITRDVSAGFTGTGYDPVVPTGTWRDSGSTNGLANPDRRVEDALTGQLFIFNGPTTNSFGVPFASKGVPIWRNSASVQVLTTGTTYATSKNNIGYEADYPSGGATQPTNQVSLNPTSITNNGKGVNANGTVYTGSPGALTLSMTLYRRSSGALVFNTGSWRGWWGVGRFPGGASSVSAGTVDVNWQNALLAALFDLGAAPVTLRAVRDGGDTALTDPAVGAPGGSRDNVAVAYGLTVATTASATLTGAGSLTASPATAAAVTLAGAGSLTAAAAAASSATFAGSGSLTATATVVAAVSATLAGSGTVTAGSTSGVAATLAGTGALTVTPAQTATASLTGAGGLASTAATVVAAAFTGAGTLAAAPTQVQVVAASLAGAGSLTCTPTTATAATLAGAGALTATPLRIQPVTVTLAGAGSLAAAAASAASTMLLGAGALAATPTVSMAALAVLAGSGSLSSAPSLATSAALAGAGSLSAAATLIRQATAALAGSGLLSAAPAGAQAVTGTLAGAGSVAATPTVTVAAAASLAGSGSLTAGGIGVVQGAALLAGAGLLVSVSLAANTAVLAGSGLLAANASQQLRATATFAAAGLLTAAAVAFMPGIGVRPYRAGVPSLVAAVRSGAPVVLAAYRSADPVSSGTLHSGGPITS